MATVARSTTADSFLEGLAARDLDGLAATMTDDVHLRGVLPRQMFELQGRDDVLDQFHVWFGDAEQFELVETAAGHVGSRLQLRWRARVHGGPFGDRWYAVEQHAYADVGPDERIEHLWLVCSGFQREAADG